MTRPLRIAIADDEAGTRDFLRQILALEGHTVVAVAGTGRELIEQCRATRPELIITDVKMPDGDGIEAAGVVTRELPTPVIFLSAEDDPHTLERAGDDHVMGYLVKPITADDLRPAIRLAVRRFEQLQALHKETGDLRQALADRQWIEQAKGAVMRRLRVDEPEAFRRLRKLSSDRNWKLAEVARKVLDAEAVFAAIEHAPGPR